MNRTTAIRLFVAVTAMALVLGAPVMAGDVEAKVAFEKLKSLAGDWNEGASEGDHKAHHAVQVSANGSVVMETMNPGTAHEMINMYHLDGEELVLTHYCAGGNQPTMQLDRAASTPTMLVFDFTGGTNLDPAVDSHIHSAQITWDGADQIESKWFSYSAGKQAGEMIFDLKRSTD
jgi:hypothetical protein